MFHSSGGALPRLVKAVLAAALVVCVSGAGADNAKTGEKEKVRRTIRLVQDDAQDYMASKVYVLKYVQSNDVTPFVSGMVKRYNVNSVVNCIEFGPENEQILTVTCPVGMMPYVDEFMRKVDRNVKIDGKVPGDVIKGTGITRAVYTPRYRSGQVLVDLVVNAFINAGPYGSVYGWDANSNQIYWKDNTSNSSFMYQFLAFLDRPAPQIVIDMKVYEVRESVLRDIGIDYLAWKNGPGLDVFQTAFSVFDVSSGGTAAIEAMSGPMGGFFFAPQFDASFVRILEQNGNSEITSTASLTVSNSDTKSYEIMFNPEFQNITKGDNDQMDVSASGSSYAANDQIYVKVSAPTACIHSGDEIDFTIPNYAPGMYGKAPGTLFFGYEVQTAGAVERNNYGSELVETTQVSGNASIRLNEEIVLAAWDKEQEVTQTIGVPYLCGIPVLKYLFGTEVTTREKTHVCLTVTAHVMDGTSVFDKEAGKLHRLK